MQLRIARLCLDCEELHVDDRCPICASDQYAFLSAWLPSEERRKWRRPAAAGGAVPERPLRKIFRTMARWIGVETKEPPRDGYKGPRTRASDHVPHFDLDGKGESQPQQPAQAPRPLPHDR